MVLALAQFGVILPVVVAICAVAVAAGVGGGALYMPFYVWVTGDAHIAVPLAKITTNGVAWSAFFFNFFARHPEEDQPLINYDVALLLEPLTLFGTIIGVICNLLMTNGQILLTLITVTSFTAIATFEKGWEKKKEEDVELSQRLFEGSPRSAAELCNLTDGTPVTARESSEFQYSGSETASGVPLVKMSLAQQSDAIRKSLAYDARQYPWGKIIILLFSMTCHAASLFAVGGPLQGLCGNFWKNCVLAGNFVVQLLITMIWRRQCLQRQEEKDKIGIAMSFRFDAKTTLVFPFLSMCAGICAGALGIAGGLIKGPIMIQWGVLPQASTATAIFMILFTSSSTILQFLLLGRVELAPGALLWVTGFVGGLVGSHVVKVCLKRHGRQSFVSMFLACIIVLSGLCMAGVVIAKMMEWVPNTTTSRRFTNFCDVAENNSYVTKFYKLFLTI